MIQIKILIEVLEVKLIPNTMHYICKGQTILKDHCPHKGPLGWARYALKPPVIFHLRVKNALFAKKTMLSCNKYWTVFSVVNSLFSNQIKVQPKKGQRLKYFSKHEKKKGVGECHLFSSLWELFPIVSEF